MRRAILVESELELRELYELNLDLYLGIEVISLDCDQRIFDFLENDQDVDLIICERLKDDEEKNLKVYEYLQGKNLEIPIYLLCDEIREINDFKTFQRENWQAVIRAAAQALQITAEEMVSLQVPDYYPIPIKHFKQIKNSKIDIFDCSVGEEDGGFPKFEVIFPANTAVSQLSIKNKLKDGKKNFYVNKFDRLKFLNEYAETVISTLAISAGNEHISATANVFYAAQEMLNAIGMTEHSIEMAKTTIDQMMKISQEAQGLSQLMDVLCKSKAGYLFSHATLIAAVSHYVLEKMKWGTPEQQEKVCVAAFFHDITIPNEKLAKISNVLELKRAKLSIGNEEKVLTHAYDACAIIRSFPNAPIGVDMIILHHHCHTGGRGFPSGYSSQLTPLAIVFFVVEEFVSYMLQTTPEEFSKEYIISNFRSRFNKGHYRKVIDALDEAKID